VPGRGQKRGEYFDGVDRGAKKRRGQQRWRMVRPKCSRENAAYKGHRTGREQEKGGEPVRQFEQRAGRKLARNWDARGAAGV